MKKQRISWTPPTKSSATSANATSARPPRSWRPLTTSAPPASATRRNSTRNTMSSISWTSPFSTTSGPQRKNSWCSRDWRSKNAAIKTRLWKLDRYCLIHQHQQNQGRCWRTLPASLSRLQQLHPRLFSTIQNLPVLTKRDNQGRVIISSKDSPGRRPGRASARPTNLVSSAPCNFATMKPAIELL